MLGFHNYPPTEPSDAYLSNAGMRLLNNLDTISLATFRAYGEAASTELIDAYKDRELATSAARHLINTQLANPSGARGRMMAQYFSEGLFANVTDILSYSRERAAL